ncbi:MAG: 2-oxoacid:acceptor oxidoreductase subunit alpha, partial [Proteobacteria bacterium]|nr:2-oxoacid:acceptor oxidoreductase subunit alpha [Pseudomonadota bacterium]
LTAPFAWDAARAYDRGKVMTTEELEAGTYFARYEDVDGDGIPWRTIPATHPKRGSFFTRGTSKNPQARYSERGDDYLYNMQRLLKKFDTAKSLVPQPILHAAKQKTRFGAIYYGSTSPAMDEALAALDADGLHVDALRVRAFPFPDSVAAFIAAHDTVFVVEQNRDAQLHGLIVIEFGIDPARLEPVLHYDGTPITARFIARKIGECMQAAKIVSIESKAAHS